MSRPIKGQIIVYTITGCPHCKAAKTSLLELDLPFFVVNLDNDSENRNDLFRVTEMKTLPQIFFNEVFVGGNSELQKLISDAQQFENMLIMLDTTEAPEGSPKFAHDSSEEISSALDLLQTLPDEYKDLVRKMQDPVTGVSIADRLYHFKIYKRCFIGSQAVDWLCKEKKISRREAVALGNILREKYFFKHVVNDHVFKDKYLFFRFVHHETSKALNNKKLTLQEPQPASEVAFALRKIILSIYDEFLSADGKGVDYVGLGKSQKFAHYEELSFELQRTDIFQLSVNERKAFFINTYNTLMIHAYVRNGFPATFWQRMKFFTTNSYLIGGQSYSLDDIEHGILRANTKSLLAFQPPFPSGDPRLGAVIPLDPRIHFSLVCGAKGCPPIKNYTPENIDQELDMAGEAFLESVVIDGNKIIMSKILSWYKADFGSSSANILKFVKPFLKEEKQTKLSALLQSGNFKISYAPYDWATNKQ